MYFARIGSTLAIVLAAVACGSPPQPATAPPGTVGNPAETAARANDPRTSDATAAAPPESAPKRTVTPPEDPTPAEPSAKKPATEVPKRIGARHVLIQWMGSERAASSVVRSRDQALSLAKEVLRRAKAGDDFARLAVEYSDEPNASGRGGSLGRFSHGQMVPAFEAAAFKLEIGQISDIVETPFGFHVIQRTE